MSNLFGALVCFDLTRVSGAYAIINLFVDDETVRLFELTPTGREAHLILTLQDPMAAQVLHQEVTRQFSDIVKASVVINESATEIAEILLHQATSMMHRHVLAGQSSSLSAVLNFALKALKQDVQIIEIRTLKTDPKSVQFLLTSSDEKVLSHLIKECDKDITCDLILNVTKPFKDLFEFDPNDIQIEN